MSWSSIIDQQRVVSALQAAVAGDRIAHAYLFHGPDGVGKRAVALEFARAVLCERGGGEACDQCIPCSKAARMIHPDLHFLMPHPTDVDADDITPRLQRLAQNPYASVDFVRRPSLTDPTKTSNKQSLYTIARINEELRRTVSFRPVEGRYKIVVMTDADLLRIEAANAFLKILEEPTPRTLYILTSSRPDRLLPTVLSRCQRLRFDPLPADAIEAALVSRGGADPELAGTLARMADGSYSRALDIAETGELAESRGMVLEYFRLSYKGDIDKLSDLVSLISRLGRERIKGILDLMLRWVRDLMLYRTTKEPELLVNVDQLEAIVRFNENLPKADLEAMVSLLEDAIELIGRNVHIPLTLTALAQNLRHAMRGPHGGDLYVPLVEERFSKAG